MRRFSYDLLSIPEFFKDDALIDHSYKSYNPQIGTSLKILKCVLMCRASGKLVSGFKWIQHDSIQHDSAIPKLAKLATSGFWSWLPELKYGLPAFCFESVSVHDSLRSFQAPGRFGTCHHFRYLHIRSLELPTTCQVT